MKFRCLLKHVKVLPENAERKKNNIKNGEEIDASVCVTPQPTTRWRLICYIIITTTELKVKFMRDEAINFNLRISLEKRALRVRRNNKKCEEKQRQRTTGARCGILENDSQLPFSLFIRLMTAHCIRVKILQTIYFHTMISRRCRRRCRRHSCTFYLLFFSQRISSGCLWLTHWQAMEWCGVLR